MGGRAFGTKAEEKTQGCKGITTNVIRSEALATRVEAIAIRSKDATGGYWPYY